MKSIWRNTISAWPIRWDREPSALLLKIFALGIALTLRPLPVSPLPPLGWIFDREHVTQLLPGPHPTSTREKTTKSTRARKKTTVASARAKAKRAKTRPLTAEQRRRIAHAKELMGSVYASSAVKRTESLQSIETHVRLRTKNALPKKWKNQAGAIATAILSESRKYGFDPIFLMAVIENESSFNPGAMGAHGEIGLLQILPKTGEWISKKFGLMKWKGPKTLANPVASIKIGAAYLNHLKQRFDSHGRLYLAAYNMGTANVNRALNKKIWPKEYAGRVMKRYLRMYEEIASAKKAS